MNQQITFEALEELATQLEADVEKQRQKLLRLCRGYHRILALRERQLFERKACHFGDEAGHYDSSFPPRLVYSERNGPRALRLAPRKTEDIPTSGGYYYSWRRVTTYGGLCISLHGEWLRSEETGTGELGQFAAYPGDCKVDCTIAWGQVGDDDVELDELTLAEEKLRGLAFPASAAAAS